MSVLRKGRNKFAILSVSLLAVLSCASHARDIPETGQERIVLKRSKNFSVISARVLKKIALPEWYHEGLYREGRNIWVSNGKCGRTWVVDTSSGEIVNKIEPAGTFTESVFRGPSGRYFISDWEDKKIYVASLEGNIFKMESSFSVAPAHPAGLLWNGGRLFAIIWTRGIGTKFELLEMTEDLRIVRTVSIQRIQEPSQLAWDGEFLWISSWFDKRVYKVAIDDWEIEGLLRSPVSMTTGLAWDGKHLWLTGTDADLYQLEVL